MYGLAKLYCARGDMENRIKECQIGVFADRTPASTMRTNQLRLWFASFAYLLVCALSRSGSAHNLRKPPAVPSARSFSRSARGSPSRCGA